MIDVENRALGSKGMDPDETFTPSPNGEVIGWYVCLKNGTFRPKARAIRKLMYEFLSVDLTSDKLDLKQCQKLFLLWSTTFPFYFNKRLRPMTEISTRVSIKMVRSSTVLLVRQRLGCRWTLSHATDSVNHREMLK